MYIPYYVNGFIRIRINLRKLHKITETIVDSVIISRLVKSKICFEE